MNNHEAKYALPLVSTHLGSRLPLSSVHGAFPHVSPCEIGDLRDMLESGRIPVDFASKLTRLARGSLVEAQIEQNCSLFIELLQAARESGFSGLRHADRNLLCGVLAYVRKDEDTIPDYWPNGFVDDHAHVRSVRAELGALLHQYKSWRLKNQVPMMWLAQPAARRD